MQLNNQQKTTRNNQQLILLLHYLQLHDYRFTTISPASHQLVNSRTLNQLASSLTDIFGWNRTFKLESLDSDLLKLMQSAEILQEADDGWKSIYRVAYLDGLLFYHSSFPTVENDAVFFGPDTYRFARSIQQFSSQHNKVINNAVDIGSGSGVGAALIALAFPKANVIALDINSAALDLADINFAAAGLGQIIVKQSNLLSNVDGNFDLIVANPPYLIDESQRAYRHGGGETGEGLSLEIVDAALTRLNPNGVLLLYTGVAIINGQDAFLNAITQKLKFAAINYSYNEIDPDIFGEELAKEAYASVDRIAAVVLIMHKHPA